MTTDETNFIRHRFGGPAFIRTGGQLPVHLLRLEIETLATVNFHGFLSDYWPTPSDVDREILLSLIRLGLVDEGRLHESGRETPGCMVSATGREILAEFRSERFGCRCEHSVRMPCMCSERTFCPDPDHTGNGCHGSHD